MLDLQTKCCPQPSASGNILSSGPTYHMLPSSPVNNCIIVTVCLTGQCYTILLQTTVELCMAVLLQSSEHFIKPTEFIPERWLREDTEHNIHPYLLTPFGIGPRMCAGQ